jgi:hypothetical protein
MLAATLHEDLRELLTPAATQEQQGHVSQAALSDAQDLLEILSPKHMRGTPSILQHKPQLSLIRHNGVRTEV